jgi:hypothetical protein
MLCVFLAACASERRSMVAQPAVARPARFASAEEAARLHAEAAANFQRERERQGMVAGSRIPNRVTVQAVVLPPVLEGPSEQPRPRRKISQAEARYAMQIGKSPFELTPGERAVAAGN